MTARNRSSYIKRKVGRDKQGRIIYQETPTNSSKEETHVIGKDKILTLKIIKLTKL